MTPSKSKYGNNSFRIKTVPSSSDLFRQGEKYHRYDASIYHKTPFHLQPLKQNPELFTKMKPLTKQELQKIKEKKFTIKKINDPVLPASINIRNSLLKFMSLEKSLEKLLEEDTKILVTARKWAIFDMESNKILKGYKYKKVHDIASLTKILTFYTAYMIIQKYFISLDKLFFAADEYDAKIPGTKIKIQSDNLMNIEDLLYAMMLNSANNAATILATNLGSFVQKKRKNSYFSCYDLPNENKHKNMAVFIQLMNQYVKQLQLQTVSIDNVHGLCKNMASPRDIAILTSQCFKIPLFSKIVMTKTYTAKIRYIGQNGEMNIKQVPLKNTNKLLWLNSGCIGGKTGSNNIGGDSLMACYEGNIVVVVLGSHGREQKFADCERLIGWLHKKLQYKEQ